MTDDALLTTREAARRLGISASKLSKDRLIGASPRYVKLGASVRYRRSDLESFVAANIRRSTSESAKAS